MSFDVPVHIESQIQRVADAEHISHDEALVRIIEAGLERMLPTSVSPRDILGAFSSEEESVVADEALALAMNDREQRNAQASHA